MHSLPNLPAKVSRDVYAILAASLPPTALGTAEAHAERISDAMDAVAALRPADSMEARLAADIVATEAYALDCLSLAGEHRSDLRATLSCRAQATAMLKQMRSLLRDYEVRQALHDKALAESHPVALGKSGYWFKEISVPEPEPPAEPPPDTTVPGAPPPDSTFERMTETEQYAVLYEKRAARIRQAGGLPESLDFPPPDPKIVEALVTGTSPILQALDHLAAGEAATGSSVSVSATAPHATEPRDAGVTDGHGY